MPTNKNAQLRYKILDRYFYDFNYKYVIDALFDKVNETLYYLYGTKVSLRQLSEDMKYMRDRITYNTLIKAYLYDDKKCSYRYEGKDFFIFNNTLSVREVYKLRSIIEMQERFHIGSKNAWFEEIISNLDYRFGVKWSGEYVVSFDQNEQLRSQEFLGEPNNPTFHQPFHILYRSYSCIKHNSIIHPYHIKQFNNRWFLLGLELSLT